MDFPPLTTDVLFLGNVSASLCTLHQVSFQDILLKLNYAFISHMVLIFDVRTPFTLFSSITFMDFSNHLVHILLCRGYGKGRLQNLKGRETVKIL